MTYIKVSIPKKSGGSPGAPLPKHPTIVLVNVRDILTFPETDANGVKISGDLTLKVGATAQGIYATPSSISRGTTSEGDPDAEGFIQNLVFDHPGNTLEIDEFTQNNIAEDFVIISRGEKPEDTRLQGSLWNPMKLTFSATDNNEGNKGTFTFKSVLRTKKMAAHYTGAIPTLAADATYDEGSSAGGL